MPLLLDKASAQGRMTRHQVVEGRLQGVEVQRPAQAQRHRNVIGRACRLVLPEKPLTLLCVRQRQALRALTDRRNGQLRQAHAFGTELFQEGLALRQRQTDEALDQGQLFFITHVQIVSNSERKSCSSLRSLSEPRLR
ncbi:hypothetical protein D9M71_710050 [compost metagenome]